jgi:hypothetical protein
LAVFLQRGGGARSIGVRRVGSTSDTAVAPLRRMAQFALTARRPMLSRSAPRSSRSRAMSASV